MGAVQGPDGLLFKPWNGIARYDHYRSRDIDGNVEDSASVINAEVMRVCRERRVSVKVQKQRFK